jgi:hypothetical protein
MSIYVRCIVLHEFILICVVLGLFMLTASKCMFSRMLLWLYKLILNPVNFLTGPSPWERRNFGGSGCGCIGVRPLHLHRREAAAADGEQG